MCMMSHYSLAFQVAERHGKDRNKVKRELQNLFKKLYSGAVNQVNVAAVCFIYSDRSRKFLSCGASIHRTKPKYKQIWIALSCMITWHSHVSYVVMMKLKGENPTRPFPPLGAVCTAYDDKMKKKDPCLSCCELFSLTRGDKQSRSNNVGNCAEVEAISEFFRFRRVPDFSDEDTHREWSQLRETTQKMP